MGALTPGTLSSNASRCIDLYTCVTIKYLKYSRQPRSSVLSLTCTGLQLYLQPRLILTVLSQWEFCVINKLIFTGTCVCVCWLIVPLTLSSTMLTGTGVCHVCVATQLPCNNTKINKSSIAAQCPCYSLLVECPCMHASVDDRAHDHTIEYGLQTIEPTPHC